LKGTFEIGTTNLNLDVGKIKNPLLRDLVAVVAKLPDIASNPIGAAESIVTGIASRTVGKFTGGLSDEVSKSPINVITARGNAADGKVIVQQAVARSTVFEADVTNGTVTLAPVLTNSPINFPISIRMNEPIVARIPILAGSNPQTNSGYVKIPDFYVEKGTLGNPKPSINAPGFGKNVLQQFVPGLGGGSGTNGSGNLLQGVGNLLRGGGANTNQSPTNEPSQSTTNQSPVNNLLNRILK